MNSLHVISWNAAGKISSEASLESLLSTVEVSYPGWHVIFVSEADCVASTSFAVLHRSHEVFRHWPGDGSRSQIMIVRNTLSSLSKRLVSRNRMMCLELGFGKGCAFRSVCVVGVHGPHASIQVWHDFGGDLAFLLGQRETKGPFVCVGDWNIDYGPAHAHYPYRASTDETMRDRRELLDSFCEANDAVLGFADFVDSLPAQSQWHEACLSFPFTRVPVGGQSGRPSLLDFCVLSRNLQVVCSASWKHVPTDHAIFSVALGMEIQMNAFKRSTWVPSCRDDAVVFLRDNWPTDFTASSHYSAIDASPARLFEYLCTVRDRYSNSATCAQRRSRRVPFNVRLLSFKVESCAREQKQYWTDMLWRAKTQWFAEVKVRMTRSRVDRGRAVAKSKKLHCIRSLSCEEGECVDDSRIVKCLGHHFQTKYGREDLHSRELALDFVRCCEGVVPSFDELTVEKALSRCKGPLKLDQCGVCFELLRVAFEARPSEFVEWLQFLTSSESLMSSLCNPVCCFGKKSSRTPACDVRAIVPQCSLSKLVDNILSSLLFDRLTFLLPKRPGVFVGAQRFTQAKDLGAGVQLLMEKGLDMKSQSACAQADIARYFDSLPVLLCVNWLLAKKVERALLAALLRHQLLTGLEIRRGSAVFSIVGRSRGGLTGSNIARTLARIPVESVFLEVLPLCFDRGFGACSGRLVFGSWVDNIYTAAHTPDDACDLLTIVFDRLKSVWGLEMKPGSSSVLVCRGHDLSQCSFPECIQPVDVVDVLGWTVCSSASMSEQWRRLLASAWAAFHVNVRCRLWKRLGQSRRLALLERVVKPVVLHKLRAFTPSQYWFKQVCRLQNHMVSRALGNFRLPCEDFKTYLQRVSRSVRDVIGVRVTNWGLGWLSATVSWDEHVERDFGEQARFYSNFDKNDLGMSHCFDGSGLDGTYSEPTYATSFSWAALLSRHLPASYFESVRRTESRAGPIARTCTRTSTRQVHGRVLVRYHDGVTFSKSVLPAQ